jgi:hypothetical protein
VRRDVVEAEHDADAGPRRFCAASARECSGGSCTRATLGGTSGTCVDPPACRRRAARSRRGSAWLSQGTVTSTTSAALAASPLLAPRGAGPRGRWQRCAAACAFSAEREPSTIG